MMLGLLSRFFPTRGGVVIGQAPHANAFSGHARSEGGHVEGPVAVRRMGVKIDVRAPHALTSEQVVQAVQQIAHAVVRGAAGCVFGGCIEQIVQPIEEAFEISTEVT